MTVYRLDKFIIHGVRYLVWPESAAKVPAAEGVVLLLSGREGVGADRLVVMAPGYPGGVRCFGTDGAVCAVEASDRYVAALANGRCDEVLDDTSFAYSEVRLTEAFFHRLMKHGRMAKIAG